MCVCEREGEGGYMNVCGEREGEGGCMNVCV